MSDNLEKVKDFCEWMKNKSQNMTCEFAKGYREAIIDVSAIAEFGDIPNENNQLTQAEHKST